MTAVPPFQFLSTGPVVPTAAQVLAGVQADINQAFGGNLNPALKTPQGQLAQSETAIIVDANSTLVDIINGVNPSTSSGMMQDAIGRLYYMNRNPGLPTVVTVTVNGLAGVVIPVGAQVSDTSGNVYVCTNQVTIPQGGTITTTFANAALGPIPCPAGTIKPAPYQAIPGWDTASNAGSPGVVGAYVETPAAFEYRRQQTVAANAIGSLPAVYGAVFDLPGVIDVYATQNDTGSTVNTGSTNYPVVKNSIYVAVVGGDSQTIANTIWVKKMPGCNTNGNTTETVVDMNYSVPQPSYSISFERPTATPIYITVTLLTAAGLPSDYTTQIQNAVIARFTGTDGGLRARTGALLLASNYYGPVVALGPQFQLTGVTIGIAASPTNPSVQMGIDQAPTLSASNIIVVT